MQIGLVIDATLKDLNVRGQAFYILQRGNQASGIILLKLNALDGSCRLLIQQRNFLEDKLEWVAALPTEIAPEPEADAYIARAKSRDPDLWVIEIEDRAMENPFKDL